jgi:hypothetical protein
VFEEAHRAVSLAGFVPSRTSTTLRLSIQTISAHVAVAIDGVEQQLANPAAVQRLRPGPLWIAAAFVAST